MEVPITAPILPAAAEMPLQLARIAAGYVTAGNTYV